MVRETLHISDPRGALYEDYREARIPKVRDINGREKVVGYRRLLIPSDDLMLVQRQVLKNLKSLDLPVSVSSHAYQAYRSPRTCASVHVGKKYLLKMDIEDYFGSIRPERIQSCLTYFDVPEDIKNQVNRWCFLFRGLPQGAPTSPFLSNLASLKLDAAIRASVETWRRRVVSPETLKNGSLSNRIKKFRVQPVQYSRYADDLFFTSDYPYLYEIQSSIKRLAIRHGFVLNSSKTRSIKSPNRQEVLGIVVNDKPSTPKRRRRELRAKLHNLLMEVFSESFEPGYTSLSGSREEILWEPLEGLISYIQSIDREQGRSLASRLQVIKEAHTSSQETWSSELSRLKQKYECQRAVNI